MLKIWKQTWKQTDSLHHPQGGLDIDQDSTSDEPRNSTSFHFDAIEALPPDAVLSEKHNSKRPRKSIGQDDSIDHQPKKKKTNEQLTHDSITSHLPEVSGTGDAGRLAPHSLAAFREQLLEHAQLQNTVAVVPSLKSAVSILVEFLTWVVQLERSRLSPTTPRHRTALVVADHESGVDEYAAKIEAETPGFLIGKYGLSAHKLGVKSWSKLLQQDVALVSSNLLLDSLLQGTLAITQFHVLVILDAQNIQDQDSHTSVPIVQVMNGFYHITDALSRPRIFALATPPANRGFHFDSAMLKLEITLDAKFFGVSSEKRDEIIALPDRPNEVVILYEKSKRPALSRLSKQLSQLDPTQSIFRKHFKASQYALNEVGLCASDLIWRRALKEIEAVVQPWYEEDEEEGNLSTTNIQRQIRDLVKNWTFTMPNLDPSSWGFNVTPKFLKLVNVLKSCEPYGERFRGIIFVQKQAIALVIVDLLRTLDEQLGFLRPYALIGHGPLATSQHQQEIFQSFATGSYNLLIATKSAEDLEIPKALIVICFNLFESQVSHAYVRACARGRESHLVHMVEQDNEVHRRILSQITQLDTDMLRWTETLRHNFCSSVPPSTLREMTNPCYCDSEDITDPFVEDPTTSGRIYLQDATSVIYRFASNLTREQTGIRVGDSLFSFSIGSKEFGTPQTYTCTILLPGTPAHQIMGSPSHSRAHARRSACYKACEVLLHAGLLDYRLFPLPPDMHTDCDVEASLSQGNFNKIVSGTCLYPRKQPDFWINTGRIPITALHPTIILIDQQKESMQPRSPFLILTRQPLPDLVSFKLFCSGLPVAVKFRRGAAFEIDDSRLNDLYLYTLRVCRVISNKPYSCNMANMVYFFAPLALNWTPKDDIPIIDAIPWDLVSLAGRNYAVPLKTESSDGAFHNIQDVVVQDRWVEFTRRYEVIAMRFDLTPLSKPLDSPRESDYDSLVDFCKARRKGFEGLQDYTQPIIEVSKIPAIYNHLNPTSRPLLDSSKPSAKYLIPELCAKFTIPTSTLRTTLLLPSITRRIDDFLLVKELNAKFFGNVVSEELLHIAICAPSAAYDYDYERLELLGDAFLKYLSTIYVFVTNPAHNEGALHGARQKIISNKALHQSACSIGLPVYIQAKPFTPKLWHPPNFHTTPQPYNICNPKSLGNVQEMTDTVSRSPCLVVPNAKPLVPQSDATSINKPQELNKGSQKTKHHHNTQWLGDKAIADVAEAIIGAAYITGGRETALKVTKDLKIPISNIDQWSDFGRKVLAPPAKITAKLRPGSIEGVEAIIGHKIAHPHLLAQALTHSSMASEPTSYERLEFVGDAILDFMVIRHIFDRDQKLSPGGLTLLKSAMVSNSALAAICVWSGLHEHLNYESYPLATSIQDYVAKLQTKQAEEYKTAKREGRSPGQYWLDFEPPKALSDVLESIAGAIYISDNFSPIGAETLFDNVLKPFYDQHITLKTLSHHPTKILFELFQAQGCHQFEITKEKYIDRTRCDVLVHNIILSSGEDPTPTIAARRASLFALDALEGDAMFLTRTCDCRSNNSKKKQKNILDDMLRALEEDKPNHTTTGSAIVGTAKEVPVETEFEEGMILE